MLIITRIKHKFKFPQTHIVLNFKSTTLGSKFTMTRIFFYPNNRNTPLELENIIQTPTIDSTTGTTFDTL